MRYASVCDGIGAAHVAWQPLGWECAWTSEIEPFPAAVVEQRCGFKNLGDMTAITEGMLDECGAIDLLVGGTPCQSFSVAGMRRGLDDPRGNLALRFVQLVDAMRPNWVLWENVPGVLSSNGGRDFGTFLGALAGIGYGFAYRVLDAQWFGVAQRRRRVFLVANAGDWRSAAAVLFEPESLRGDSAPSRKAWQGVARTSQGSPSECGKQPFEVANCLTSRMHKGINTTVDEGQTPVVFTKAKRAQNDHDDESWVPGEVAPTQNQFDIGDTRATTVVAFAQNQLGEVRCNDSVMGTVNTNHNASGRNTPLVMAFAQNSRDEVRNINGDGSLAGCLSASDGMKQKTYLAQSTAVRRLTPRECERLQGFPDDYTAIEYRGKPAADGPRYKALGNSMAVPCMSWIGKRIELVEGCKEISTHGR